MKSLNKILCGCALLTMAASLGVGLGAKNAETQKVEAADYTQHEAYFYKAEVEASGNFYIYFAAEGGDGVNVPAIENESPNAPINAERLAEFNFLDKISFTINGVETFLKDVNPSGAVFNKFTRWGCYGMNIDPTFAASFVAQKSGGTFQNSLLTVYEGCELPTFAYGGGTSDTKESILTPVRSFLDVSRGGNVVQSFKIKGDIEIGGAYTSAHRSEEGCDFGKGIKNINLTFQFKDYSDYNETANLNLNGISSALALKEKLTINGKTFDSYIGAAYEKSIGTDSLVKIGNNFWTRTGSCIIDLNLVSEEIKSFGVKKGMIIPQSAGASYVAEYDWNTAQANFDNIKTKSNNEAYVVDKDYNFVTNGISGFTDQNLTIFHEHDNVAVNKVKMAKWSDVGYMVTLSASSPLNTYEGFTGIDGDFIKNYTFKNLEFYVGDEKLEVTYGEQFYNLDGAGTFTTRIKNGSDADGFGRLGEVTKVVVKGGMEFPEQTFCSRYSETNPTGQVVNPATEARKKSNCFYVENDIEFKKAGDVYLPVAHREYDSSTEVNLEGAYLRTDKNLYFLQIRVPDDKMNYGAAVDKEQYLPENELGNLNTLSKIHLLNVDGSEVELSYDTIEAIRYNQWGDKDLFIEFKKSFDPDKELSSVREIIFDEGLELPDFGNKTKLVSNSKMNLIHVNGTKYTTPEGDTALGHWLQPLSVFGMKNFIQMNKILKGEMNVQPQGDGDPNLGAQRVWLKPTDIEGNLLYTDAIEHNKNAIYALIFNMNMLGKVVLIKDGIETRMSDLYYTDDGCTVNIWDRPSGTITIKPMNEGFSYKNYDSIRLEAGLELPVSGFLADNGSTPIEYYVLGETITWYLNNQNSYGVPATISFGDTDVDAITGGIVENVPEVPGKTGDEEFSYTGFWKDGDGNRFDPNHIVEGDESYTADYDASRVEYKVTYLDEEGAELTELSTTFPNASEYTVEAVPAKTGYTGTWTSEEVTIKDGKFTMPTYDVTLKASYEANDYTLSFGDGIDPITVTYNEKVGSLPEIPDQEGKHSLGWFIGEEELDAETVWLYAEDKTAVAKYEDHSYEEWEDNGDGTHSSTCECGNIKTEDHNYTDHYVYNEDGETHESYCICGNHITENHNWDEGKVTKAQNCTEDGTMTYTCEDCGAVKTEVIPANGHLWDQGTVTKEATCTEDGVMTFKCDTCGATKTETIPATGHKLGELIPEVAATTEKEGMKAHYVCSVCGQFFDANKVACTQESLVIPKLPQPEPKKGCGGSVIAASAVVTGLAIAGAALIASKKKHD